MEDVDDPTLRGVVDKLSKMRAHADRYLVDVLGVKIIVLPDVWSPAYDWSSVFFIENLPPLDGCSFLDIGCGTGVISVFAARAGAQHVVSVDINPEAVRNCRLNFERFGIADSQAYVVRDFDDIEGSFDVIVWNAPHHDAPARGMLDLSCVDEGFRAIRAFFATIGSRLNSGGKLLFGYSDMGDLALLDTLIRDNQFVLRRRLSDSRDGYNCMIYELEK